MKIGIIGYGHVGKSMHKEFSDAIIYDKNLKIGSFEKVNKADVVFIAVPTPESNNSLCDTSIVEEIIKKLDVNLIIIRSTVWIGFTDLMVEKYNKQIVFQPEYYGETVDHPFANPDNKDWITLGGEESSINKAIEVYKTIKNSSLRIYIGKSKDIEMAKYMENTFLALKVTFMNEMFDIASGLDVNFNTSREAWLADPRINRSHTFVYENNRGFSGKCLPKDIASLKYQADSINVDSKLITAVIDKNKKVYNNK